MIEQLDQATETLTRKVENGKLCPG
ncbi:MAG: hypothetical protein ACLSA6_00645 [Holdemania massiliensis]